MNNVAAIIVTFNRLQLLKEAIIAIKLQSIPVQNIIIINNDSTDGTGEWLDKQTDLIVLKQANSGGAGGFFTGLAYAAKMHYSWIWVMDDDTICEPTALEKLLEKISALSNEKIGFVNSKSIWTDGKPHFMNLVDIKPFFNATIPFNIYDRYNVFLTESCSFVSVIINIETIKQVGLPYKEFFIWGDDQEYTRRITKTGYLGLYCPDSIVLHKTPNNYHTDLYNDSSANSWKYKYGLRNIFFIRKKEKGLLLLIPYLIAKLFYSSYKIIKLRKDGKAKFIVLLIVASWKAIFFSPQIKKV